MTTEHLGCHGGAPADSQRYFYVVCCFELRLRGGEERLSDIEQDGRQGRLVCSNRWPGELRASMSELAVLLSARSERLGLIDREYAATRAQATCTPDVSRFVSRLGPMIEALLWGWLRGIWAAFPWLKPILLRRLRF